MVCILSWHALVSQQNCASKTCRLAMLLNFPLTSKTTWSWRGAMCRPIRMKTTHAKAFHCIVHPARWSRPRPIALRLRLYDSGISAVGWMLQNATLRIRCTRARYSLLRAGRHYIKGSYSRCTIIWVDWRNRTKRQSVIFLSRCVLLTIICTSHFFSNL